MNVDPLYQLVWMSRPLMQAAEACVEKGLEGTGLTVRMRAVLEILAGSGDQSVPDLAAKLDIKRQYVQLMVNETLTAGWTELRPNPRHKRSSLVCLTPRGAEVIDRITSREKALMARLAVGVTDQEISTALKVVLSVTQKLKNAAEE